MTAHDLAKKLLEMPDIEVGFAYNVLGCMPVGRVYVAPFCKDGNDVEIVVIDEE